MGLEQAFLVHVDFFDSTGMMSIKKSFISSHNNSMSILRKKCMKRFCATIIVLLISTRASALCDWQHFLRVENVTHATFEGKCSLATKVGALGLVGCVPAALLWYTAYDGYRDIRMARPQPNNKWSRLAVKASEGYITYVGIGSTLLLSAALIGSKIYAKPSSSA